MELHGGEMDKTKQVDIKITTSGGRTGGQRLQAVTQFIPDDKQI
jgi:hypothetical protein